MPNMNNFPISLKVNFCVLHMTPYLFVSTSRSVAQVYVHNFNCYLSTNDYKMMTIYIIFHCIKLLYPKQFVGYTVVFLCAHLES